MHKYISQCIYYVSGLLAPTSGAGFQTFQQARKAGNWGSNKQERDHKVHVMSDESLPPGTEKRLLLPCAVTPNIENLPELQLHEAGDLRNQSQACRPCEETVILSLALRKKRAALLPALPPRLVQGAFPVSCFSVNLGESGSGLIHVPLTTHRLCYGFTICTHWFLCRHDSTFY